MNLRIGHFGQLRVSRNALFQRLLAQRLDIQPAPIVRDFNNDLPTLMERIEIHGSVDAACPRQRGLCVSSNP